MNEVIFAFLGTGFGWILKELSFFLQTRKDDTKIRKRVLFNLLEIRHNLKQLDLSADINKYSEKILLIMPEAERTSEAKTFMENMLQQYLPKLLEPTINDNLRQIREKYSEVIDSLSTIDPLSAYALSGKGNIMQAFDQLNSFYGGIISQSPDDEAAITQISTEMTRMMKPEVISNAINDMEEEIIELASSIGRRTRSKVKYLLAERDDTNDDDAKKLEALKKILNDIGHYANFAS